MVGRRQFLSGATACIAGPMVAGTNSPPGPEFPPLPPDPARPASRLDQVVRMRTVPPRLEIACRHTGENWTGWYFDVATGRYDRGALESLEWFFRDWRENVRVGMCVRLYWALSAVLNEVGLNRGISGRIELLSGYRTPHTNAALPGAASDSMHMYGRAADIRLPGLSTGSLATMMEDLQVGGVGRYPGENFVHIDSGNLRVWTGRL